MRTLHRATVALVAGAVATTLALTGCTKAERWCEYDNDRDPEMVVENWKCEIGLPDHEWEPETDHPKHKRKPIKTPRTATTLTTVRTQPRPTTRIPVAQPTTPAKSTTRR